MPMKTTLLTRAGAARRRSPRRQRAGCRDHLLHDLGGGHVAGQPRLAGGAERAVHAAAGLAGHADGDAVRGSASARSRPARRRSSRQSDLIVVALVGVSVRTGVSSVRQQAATSSSRIAWAGRSCPPGSSQPLEVVRGELLGAERPSGRAPPPPPCARPGPGRPGAAAACRGGGGERQLPGAGDGGGGQAHGRRWVGSEADIAPIVSAVRRKEHGQQRPHHGGRTSRASPAGPSARRAPAGCCPCP